MLQGLCKTGTVADGGVLSLFSCICSIEATGWYSVVSGPPVPVRFLPVIFSSLVIVCGMLESSSLIRIEPCFLQYKHRVLNTEPPGKSPLLMTIPALPAVLCLVEEQGYLPHHFRSFSMAVKLLSPIHCK